MPVRWRDGARVSACAGAMAMAALAPHVLTAQEYKESPLAGPLLAAFDTNKDGNVTAAEIKAAFDTWYDAADTQKSGSVTQEQLAAALGPVIGTLPATPRPTGGMELTDPCGGRSQHPTVACASDVEQMMAALPAAAPAKPARARKVLIFSRVPAAPRGYQHSSIPLAAKTVEELGKKTGAWTSDTSWDPAVFTKENLQKYDAIFLSNTTACFLDAPAGNKAVTEARRAAFIEFVRSGKGVAAIHATGDSYHSPCPDDEGAGQQRGFGGRGAQAPGPSLASVIVRWAWGLDDKKLQNNVHTLTKPEMENVAAAWWKQLDPGGEGKVTPAAFRYGIKPIVTASNAYVGTPGRDNEKGSWPDWDNMIGGFFKFHWEDPQHIVVKIDDKASPLTKMFNGQDFDVYDETYTFSINSFSRDNVHVLTSINYDKMSFRDKLKESNPRPDHDYGLSWIKRDGQGRVFYMALGHDERQYSYKPLMEHLLAGMQYVLGDLKADDAPTKKATQH